MSLKRFVKNTTYSIFAKITNALLQIVSLPILIKIYGKEAYGLIVLAMSLNTFIAILQLGLPSGLPKFVSEWLARGEEEQLKSSTRMATSFYLIVAFINLLILLALALFGTGMFNVEPDQVGTLEVLLIITAVTSFFAIPATSLDQLLTGAQELGFVSRVEIAKNFLFAGLVSFVFFYPESLSISQFYILRCIVMFLLVPAKISRWTRYGTLSSFVPGWDYRAALPLLKYCFSLMVFAVFGTISEKIRPIILGMRVPADAGSALSDYQIINNVRIFLMMIGSSFMVALIPHISGAAAAGNDSIFKKTIVKGTKYVWSVTALMGFGIIMLSKELLSIYVGPGNLYLKVWWIIIIFGTLYNLYITPIISVILSSGKLIPMIYATAIGGVISLFICWIMTPQYGVGGIAISLVAYNLTHLLVTHYWYLPKYFQVNPSQQVFKILMPPIIAGIIMCFTVRNVLNVIGFENNYLNICFGGGLGTLIYIGIILIVYIPAADGKELALRILKR